MFHHHVIHPCSPSRPAPRHGCEPKHDDDPCKRHLKKHHHKHHNHHHKHHGQKHHC